MPHLPHWRHTDRTLYLVVAAVAGLLAAFEAADAVSARPERVFVGLLCALVALGGLQAWSLTRRTRACLPRHGLPVLLAATALAAQWAGHFSMQAWLLATMVVLFFRYRPEVALGLSVALLATAVLVGEWLWGVMWQAHVRSLLAAALTLTVLVLISRAIHTMRADLDRNNRLLRHTIDSLSQGLTVLDADGRVVLHNQRLCELLDLPESLMAQRPTLADIVRFQHGRGDFGPAFELVDAPARAYVASFGAGSDTVHMPARYTRKTRDGRHIEVVNRPMPDGTVVRTYSDITLYMDALGKAEAAARAKGQFLANMSHELRTPLNAVLGFSELLQQSPLGSEQREQVRLIHDSGTRLLRMVNDILDYAFTEDQVRDAPMAVFELRPLIERTLAHHRHEARLKSLLLDVRVEPGVPRHLCGQPQALARVLDHLLGNALKFTTRGQVGLRVRPRADGVVLVVSDTGIGMSQAFLPRVFEAFSQQDEGNQRLHSGTGLGAALCKRLVEQLGGQITVRSELGVGTRFDVWLPWRPAVEPTSDTAATAAEPAAAPAADPPTLASLQAPGAPGRGA